MLRPNFIRFCALMLYVLTMACSSEEPEDLSDAGGVDDTGHVEDAGADTDMGEPDAQIGSDANDHTTDTSLPDDVEAEPDVPTSSGEGQVRFYMGFANGQRNICVNAQEYASGLSSLGGPIVSGYHQFDAGLNYDLWATIPPQDCSAGTVTSSRMLELFIEDGQAYTLLFEQGQTGQDFKVFEDEIAETEPGQAAVRFINLAPTAFSFGNGDVCNASTDEMIGGSLSTGTASEYYPVDPNDVPFATLHRASSEPCEGEVLGGVPVDISPDRQYTAFIIESRGSGDELVVSICEDSHHGEPVSSSCQEATVAEPETLEWTERCEESGWCWKHNPVNIRGYFGSATGLKGLSDGTLFGVDSEHKLFRYEEGLWLNLGPQFGEVHRFHPLSEDEVVVVGPQGLVRYDSGVWQTISLPAGLPRLNGVWADDDGIWAVADEGVALYHDGSSATVTTDITTTDLRTVAVDNDGVVYAGDSNATLFRKPVDGQWEEWHAIESTQSPVHQLFVQDGLVAAKAGSHVWIFSDGNWTQFDETGLAREIYLVDDQLLVLAGQTSFENNLVYRVAPDGNSELLFEASGGFQRSVWANDVEGPIYVTGDETWRYEDGELDRGLPSSGVDVIGCDGDTVAIATVDDQVVHSRDGRWQRDSSTMDYVAIAGDGTDLLAMGTGVYRWFVDGEWDNPSNFTFGPGVSISGAMANSVEHAYVVGRATNFDSESWGVAAEFDGEQWELIIEDEEADNSYSQPDSPYGRFTAIGPLGEERFAISGALSDPDSVLTLGPLMYVFDGEDFIQLDEPREADVIWGTELDDFWVVDNNNLYHFDGDDWNTHLWSVTIHDLDGTADDDVMVVGEEGTIFRFDGDEWHDESLGVEDDLLAVHVCDETTYIAGERGIVLYRD